MADCELYFVPLAGIKSAKEMGGHGGSTPPRPKSWAQGWAL